MMVNKIFGALVYFLIRLPLIALATVASVFLFIDKLLEGEYLAAFKQLLFSPLKALWTLCMLSLFAVNMGWTCGFTALFRGSWGEIRSFFEDLAATDPRLFFAVMAPELLGEFEGDYVAAFLNKLTLFFFLDKYFKTYHHYDDSPHNPLNTRTMNDVLNGVTDELYNDVMAQEAEMIAEIDAFLRARVARASDEERILVNASLRCFLRLLQEHENKSLGALDVSSSMAQHPLHVLYFVWHSIKRQYVAEPEICAAKQELLASFLGHVQRGFMRIENPDDAAPDDPECATGAVNIILSVLKVEPTLVESCDKIRFLLNERLNQLYHQENNVMTAVHEYLAMPENIREDARASWKRDDFVAKSKPKITYYARFLNETPQGRNIAHVNALTPEELEATAEGALEAWRP